MLPHVRGFAWLVVWTCLAASARAHDPGISAAQADLRGDTLTIATGFAPADVAQLLPEGARADGQWTEGDFQAVQETLRQIAPQLWQLAAGEKTMAPRETRVELIAGDNVTFHVVFPVPPGSARLTLRAPKISALPPGHRQFVIVADERGSTITKKLLSARDPAIEVVLPGGAGGAGGAGGSGGAGPGPRETKAGEAAPAAAETKTVEADTTAWDFLRLGIEHIWTGYDHLLFLFALLIVCQSFRSIAAIVTCFTLAHSLTLALATLDIVNLPARLVEPAIAASIIFVGVENLWRRGAEPPARWALTFAFGLIHGFGFAGVLRDLGVGRGGGVALPLFTFNLGVEIGQIVIAAVVLPLVWWLRKREGFVRWGVPAFSALVAGAGLFWFLQRTIFA